MDYGHNIDGYKVTIEGLKNLKPKRLIGIIGVPGDRKDDDIVKIGRMAGASFDQVIIKEDHDLRGREPQEVADLLREAVLDSGLSEERINIILDEKEALYRALDSSNSGDVIAVFFEKMEALVEIIEKFKS